jgi:hypothetical protein
MRHPDARRLYQHWLELCRGSIVPDRSDLEPSRIGAALRDVFILGIDNSDGWLVRVAGTRVTSFLGREPRDLDIRDLFSSVDSAQIDAILLSIKEDSMPVVAGVVARGNDGETYEFEALFLPLRHGQRQPTRAVGGIFPSVETASRIGLNIKQFEIISTRVIDFTREEDVVFGPIAADDTMAIQRRRNFRIIEGGRLLDQTTTKFPNNSAV